MSIPTASRLLAALTAAAPAVLAGVLVAACGTSPPGAAPEVPAGQAVIVRVVDGDTVVARLRSGEERVRLIGIDTPETKKPDTPVECFGAESSARLGQLLPAGTTVRFERDVDERDRYGRLLAYAHRLGDDLFVNRAMVAEGFAASYTVPPNVAHAADFDAAARAARRSGLGLWGRCGGNHRPAPP